MEQTSSNAYTIGLLIGSLLVGTVCGLAPLITGLIKKRAGLGIVGFISCLVGSFILGIILGLPVAVIFTLIIALKKDSNETFQPPPNPPTFTD